MRQVGLEVDAAINPRSHFLVLLTAESLGRRPLDLPIFEIAGGRNTRVVAGRSREGSRILADGCNVLYVGTAGAHGAPIRNVGLLEVLTELLGSETDEPRRASLERHIADLAGRPARRAAGAAA